MAGQGISLAPFAASTLTEPSSAGQVQYSLNSKVMLAAMLILCIVVVFVVCLHVYAKWFWRQGAASFPLSNSRDAPWRPRRRLRPAELMAADEALVPPVNVGLDPTTISSLPTFIYHASKHHDVTEPLLECAVCLSEFQPYEKGRILPDCKHSFHISCIDMWFRSHSTCPLCRAPVSPWTAQDHAQNMWIQSELTSQSSLLALPTTSHQHNEQTTSHCFLQTTSSIAANERPHEQITGVMFPQPLPYHNPGVHGQGQHEECFAKQDELILPRNDTQASPPASSRHIYCARETSSTSSVSVQIQGQAELGGSIARCQSLSMPRCQSEDIEASATLRPIKSRSFRMSIRWLISRDLSKGRGRIFPSTAGEVGVEEQDHQAEQSSSRSSMPL